MKHNQPLGIFKQNILFPEGEKAQTQSVALLATSLLTITESILQTPLVPISSYLTGHNKLPPNEPNFLCTIVCCWRMAISRVRQELGTAGMPTAAVSCAALTSTQDRGFPLLFFCFCSTCTQPKDKPWARSSKAMRFSLFYMQSPSDPVEGTGLRLALSRSVKNITSCMMPFAVLMGEGRKKNAEVLQMCYKEAEKKYGSHTFILSCCLLIERYVWIDAGELQNQFMSTTFVGCQEKHSVLLD